MKSEGGSTLSLRPEEMDDDLKARIEEFIAPRTCVGPGLLSRHLNESCGAFGIDEANAKELLLFLDRDPSSTVRDETGRGESFTAKEPITLRSVWLVAALLIYIIVLLMIFFGGINESQIATENQPSPSSIIPKTGAFYF